MILAKIISQSCQDSIIILPWSWKILSRSHHDLAMIPAWSCQDLSWFFFIHISCWAVFFDIHKYRYNEPWSNLSHISQYCQYSIIIFPWSWTILPRFHHDLAMIPAWACQDLIYLDLGSSWHNLLSWFYHDHTKNVMILKDPCERRLFTRTDCSRTFACQIQMTEMRSIN